MKRQRNNQQVWTPAEFAIYNAMQEVEKMGADVSLTKAVVLLSDAQNAVADFIDAQLLNNEQGVQGSDTTGSDSNSSADPKKISSCGQVSEQEQDYIGDRIKKEMEGFYIFNHPARKTFDAVCWRLYGQSFDSLCSNDGNQQSGFWLDIILPAMEQYAKEKLTASSQPQDREGLTGEQEIQISKINSDFAAQYVETLTDEEIEKMVGESWEEANRFFHNQGGVNPTPFRLGFIAGYKSKK